jgi:hypothetical protein
LNRYQRALTQVFKPDGEVEHPNQIRLRFLIR